MIKWIYTAMIRPIISYAYVSWAGGLNEKDLVRKLTKMQKLAQSYTLGQAFRDKNFGLNSGLRRVFCLKCTKI